MVFNGLNVYTAGDIGRLFDEGWGAGIRDDNGNFVDVCGVTDLDAPVNIEVERFEGSDGDEKAESRVLCGRSQPLEVRHQFRTAERRDGCEG